MNKTIRVTVTPRCDGVPVPTVSAQGGPPEVLLGSTRRFRWMKPQLAFRRVLDEVPQLAGDADGRRLARDLPEDATRVNALQHVFIPQYEETVAY